MALSKLNVIFALISYILIIGAQKEFKDLAVSKAFEKAKIVPDIISITWDAASAELGNTIWPALMVLMPKIEFETTPGKYYTRVFFDQQKQLLAILNIRGAYDAVYLTDPDASSPVAAVYGSHLLLLYVNSPDSNVSSGFSVAPRIPSTPAPGSRPHRYISLVYEQRDYINPHDETLIDYGIARTGFNVRKMAEDYGFDPVAGNFYYGEILNNYDKNTCSLCGCNNKI